MTWTERFANKEICTVGSGSTELCRIIFVWVSSNGGRLLTILAAFREKSMPLGGFPCLEHVERYSVRLDCQPDWWEQLSAHVCVCAWTECAYITVLTATWQPALSGVQKKRVFLEYKAFKNYFLAQTAPQICTVEAAAWQHESFCRLFA